MVDFESDLSQEIILSKYLDQLYIKKNLDFDFGLEELNHATLPVTPWKG